MRSNSRTVILALVIATAHSCPPSNGVCKPGTSYPAPDGCNTCYCMRDGSSRCSKKICSPIKFCNPGETFSLDGCNTCYCGRDGSVEACTLRVCPTPLEGQVRLTPKTVEPARMPSIDLLSEIPPRRPPSRLCTPGETYFIDRCNRCTCGPDGFPQACTQRACIDGPIRPFPPLTVAEVSGERRILPTIDIYPIDPSICVPGTSYPIDLCNTCTCGPNGQSISCTSYQCPPILGHVCTPGHTYSPDGCNTCTCDPNGQFETCTQAYCPPGPLNPIFTIDPQ